MGAAGSQVGDEGALVVGGYFEGTAGAGGALLKDEGDILPFQALDFLQIYLNLLQIFLMWL